MTSAPSGVSDEALTAVLKRAGGIIESEMRGSSMGLTLPAGTRIRIRCGATPSDPRGAVIAFVAGRGLVGHRVEAAVHNRRGETRFLTRGDAMILCDPPIEDERVLGEVVAWKDGDAWRQLPPLPQIAGSRRAGRALAYGLVWSAMAVGPRFATRVVGMLAAMRRLVRRAPRRVHI